MNQKTSRLVSLACGLVLATGALAQTTELAGVSKLTLNSGANFISTPLHQKAVHVGTITAVTANTITFAGIPGWTNGTFAAATVPGASGSVAQYAAIVRTDANATPGVQGDWWLVTGNTGSTLTVNNAGVSLVGLLPVGSELEIRPLTSIKDIFGSGASVSVIADTDFDFLATQEDVIRVVQGTSFAGEFVYHNDGTPAEAGWYYNGEYNGDGSTLRISPGQPLMFFRKTGAAPLTIGLKGSVQTRRLSTYLAAGANAVGMVYPVDANLTASNLKESGWNSDVNFDVLTTEEDVGRVVNGTSFGQDFFHYAGPDDVNGWYVGGALNTSFNLATQRGYILFRKAPTPLTWRQAVPFSF